MRSDGNTARIHGPISQTGRKERDMKRHSLWALTIIAPFAMSATAAPVEGPDSVFVKTMTVRYDAEQILDRKSAEKLFFRIRAAAEEVCRIASFPVGYEMWDEHACAVDAVAEAVRNAGLPALDRYYFRDSRPVQVTHR
jgi:UrcA family protein